MNEVMEQIIGAVMPKTQKGNQKNANYRDCTLSSYCGLIEADKPSCL
jgi:hypothetical protein